MDSPYVSALQTRAGRPTPSQPPPASEAEAGCVAALLPVPGPAACVITLTPREKETPGCGLN